MHLVAGETERIDDGAAAVDLGQSPGDIVLISSADSELAAFAAAVRRSPDGPSLRLVNFMRLGHPYSVDLYAEKTLAAAKLVVLRLIGGAGYWPYGLDVLRALARGGGPKLIVVPADARWDDSLAAWSTVGEADCRAFWDAAVAGGPANSDRALALLRHVVGHGERPSPAEPLPVAGIHYESATIGNRPLAVIVFYRALLEGGSIEPVDVLAAALEAKGLAVRAIYVTSPKNGEAAAFLAERMRETPPAVVINGTAFALSAPGRRAAPTVLDTPGRPVLQVVFAGTTREAWAQSARGLSPRDMIMTVVLPEVDGRILTRAVSFKEELPPDPLVDSRIVAYRADHERIAFVAAQAAALVDLGEARPKTRRIAIILSNYPGRDGRFGNAVGLDTGESCVRIVDALAGEGYDVAGVPRDVARLMAMLSEAERGSRGERGTGEAAFLPLADYLAFHDALPAALRQQLAEHWGAPEADPFLADGGFKLALLRFGNLVVGVQPTRGHGLDPKASYHDPNLPPPHHYLAFYAWLRTAFRAEALVQLGKHGNLEWLPGKAVGLSADCWPEAVLGPVPLVYPFIVNDPGEGAQAKRRSAAVIIDHLMPPLARAEAHGPFAELETLIDEYHLALGADPRRRDDLERDILDRAARHGIDRDLSIGGADTGEALRAIDAHLCDIKEMQIRDGLHLLGASPAASARIETLAAIARIPRTGGRPSDASLVRAIADDLGLAGFDPLLPDRAAPWTGPKPESLAAPDDAPWRTESDTAERLETLARRCIEDALAGTLPQETGGAARAVLDFVVSELVPALDRSGADEMSGLLAALDGRFVPPGPAGSPSRGRPDALPTGRNFYTVDTRAVPTEAAWRIGRKAAEALVMRYLQDEGEWPRSVALTVWGTSNMRTGGDEIAEVLALIGAEPVWETGTGRVTGFRVLTLAELKRPRVDVTLRISGLFRDAFPEQIDLIDSAIRAVAARDEPDDANPLAAARRNGEAAARIFGAAPGAYGTGIEAMMALGAWNGRGDLAEVFLGASSHAYGGGQDGADAGEALRARLGGIDLVVQNQDNREHDILDSDEYHQHQGGLALAAEHLSGAAPRLYHGDHALTEQPVIRPLTEEIGRVVRGRATNPKWIAGVMRHGFRGAAEMAATVDYLAGFAATTHAVGDHHFDALFDAYLADERVADFIAEANPAAFAAMLRRFEDCLARGLWSPRRNSTARRLAELSAGAANPIREDA